MIDPQNTLASRVAAGDLVFTAWSGIPDHLAVDSIAASGFDAVTLDMQHGGHHEDSVLRSVGAILARGKPAIVRIPVGRFDMASRALDFGADAVIAPMINTVEDARAFAESMKYPPVGGRSWGPSFAIPRRGLKPGQPYLESANKETLAIAMIETREALAIVDDILALDGIDGVFVGPSDFSIAWSGGKTIDPANPGMMDAIASIASKAVAAGKLAAIYVINPPTTGAYVKMGFRLIAFANETIYIARGAGGMIDEARASIGD